VLFAADADASMDAVKMSDSGTRIAPVYTVSIRLFSLCDHDDYDWRPQQFFVSHGISG